MRTRVGAAPGWESRIYLGRAPSPHAVAAAATVVLPHRDGLGSVRLLSDATGNVFQDYRTDEFGLPTLRVGPSAQPFRYTGEQWDVETGLLYLRDRYYDPYTGRFVSRDPVAEPDGNPYVYVGNNPINLTDPSGDCPMCIAAVVLAVKYGPSVVDAVFTAQTLLDPQASQKEKLLAVGLFAAGVATEGGGVTALRLAGRGAKVLRRGEEAAPALRIVGSACGINSFSGDTVVATADGGRPIGTLHVGDRVLAYDEATGRTGSYTIRAIVENQDAVVTVLRIAGERLETTAEHPFYVDGRGWVAAGELRAGDRIRRADGTAGVVELVTTEYRPQVMYNLSVAGAQTFFVGDQQWLVHNSCAPDFVVSPRGVAIPTSKSRLESGFRRAGFQSYRTAGHQKRAQFMLIRLVGTGIG